jgi:hypothetical protein
LHHSDLNPALVHFVVWQLPWWKMVNKMRDSHSSRTGSEFNTPQNHPSDLIDEVTRKLIDESRKLLTATRLGLLRSDAAINTTREVIKNSYDFLRNLDPIPEES